MQGMIQRLMDPDAPAAFPVAGNFKMNEGKTPSAEYTAYMANRQKQIDAIGGQQKIQELRAQARAQGMGFIQAGRFVNQQIKSLYAAQSAPKPPAAPAPLATPAAPAAAPAAPAAAAPAAAPSSSGLVAGAMGSMPSAQQTAVQGGVKTVDVPEPGKPQAMMSSLTQVRR